MRLNRVSVLVLVGFLVALLPAQAGEDEPQRVTVQHILIGFKRSIPNKPPQERSKKEAKTLAQELLLRAQAGEDFDALVEEYTNDSYPGFMLLTNKGEPRLSGGYTRDQVMPKFGDVSFRLEVGQVGIANYHAGLSAYGWHIIKRVE